MSLDVSLVVPGKDREDFNLYELRHIAVNFAINCEKGYQGSFDSWFAKINPKWRKLANKDNSDYEVPTEEIYSANITHNLGEMADEAGLYEALWRPYRLKEGYNVPEDDYEVEREFESNCVIQAKEIIPILEKGLKELVSHPEKYKKFNPSNGWGSYESLIKFTKAYLLACIANPEAEIETDR
jgi:hypothetical protein